MLLLTSNEFRVALKNQLGVKLYLNAGKRPFCISGILTVMGGYAMVGVICLLVMIIYETKLLWSSTVPHLWAEKFTYRPQFQTGRHILTCMEGNSVSSIGYHRNFSLATAPYHKCVDEKGFSTVRC